MSESSNDPKLQGLMDAMADQFEADGCTGAATLFRNPPSAKEAHEMHMAFSKLNEVFRSKKAFFKKASALTKGQDHFHAEEVANTMICDLYERVKSWEGPGAGLAALIARSKFGATHINMTDKLFGEMRRLMNMDEKTVEEELRKLGVTLDLVEPAVVGAKPKKQIKRKSLAREPVEESEFEKWVKTRPWYPLFREARPWYPDEKPSPAKKPKSEK